MGKPSPAVLRSCAEQLRTLATQQEQNAQNCDDLLAGVLGLANGDTWNGTYPTTTNAEFTTWKTGLIRSAGELRAEASSWRQTATTFDNEADAAASTGVGA